MEPVAEPRRGLVFRARRSGLVILMSLATVNIWTGGPLLALWVGSRVQGSGPPSMGAIGVVAVTLGAVSFVLVRLLAGLEEVYARVTGRVSGVRRHVPWLRSMRGERPHKDKQEGHQLTPLEIILVGSVVVVVVLFEVWFFFFSGSPIGQTSGRG